MQFACAVKPTWSGVENRFAGGRVNRAKTVDLQTEIHCKRKLEELQQGLSDLQAWDKQVHQDPVLKKMDIAGIVSQGHRFLHKQAQAKTGVPVPYMVGVAGGTASGKSFMTLMLDKILKDEAHSNPEWTPEQHGPVVDYLQLDYSYYRDMSERRKALGEEQFFSRTNLDTPNSMTLGQAAKAIERIQKGQAYRVPQFKFEDSSRREGSNLKVPTPFFMVEGLFALLPKKLRERFDLKVFVDASEQIRSERWWKRAPERNIKPDKAGWALFNRSMGMHNKYVEGTKEQADIVLNGNARQPELSETLKRMANLLLKTFYPPTREK